MKPREVGGKAARKAFYKLNFVVKKLGHLKISLQSIMRKNRIKRQVLDNAPNYKLMSLKNNNLDIVNPNIRVIEIKEKKVVSIGKLVQPVITKKEDKKVVEPEIKQLLNITLVKPKHVNLEKDNVKKDKPPIPCDSLGVVSIISNKKKRNVVLHEQKKALVITPNSLKKVEVSNYALIPLSVVLNIENDKKEKEEKFSEAKGDNKVSHKDTVKKDIDTLVSTNKKESNNLKPHTKEVEKQKHDNKGSINSNNKDEKKIINIVLTIIDKTKKEVDKTEESIKKIDDDISKLKYVCDINGIKDKISKIEVDLKKLLKSYGVLEGSRVFEEYIELLNSDFIREIIRYNEAKAKEVLKSSGFKEAIEKKLGILDKVKKLEEKAKDIKEKFEKKEEDVKKREEHFIDKKEKALVIARGSSIVNSEINRQREYTRLISDKVSSIKPIEVVRYQTEIIRRNTNMISRIIKFLFGGYSFKQGGILGIGVGLYLIGNSIIGNRNIIKKYECISYKASDSFEQDIKIALDDFSYLSNRISEISDNLDNLVFEYHMEFKHLYQEYPEIKKTFDEMKSIQKELSFQKIEYLKSEKKLKNEIENEKKYVKMIENIPESRGA